MVVGSLIFAKSNTCCLGGPEEVVIHLNFRHFSGNVCLRRVKSCEIIRFEREGEDIFICNGLNNQLSLVNFLLRRQSKRSCSRETCDTRNFFIEEFSSRISDVKERKILRT